jgi:hypothetical protein
VFMFSSLCKGRGFLVDIHSRYCIWEAMHTESENGIQDTL